MTGEVSPLGRDDEPAPPDQLRASHEDRDRVVELLRVAAGDGRLTAEELDERLEVALTARTYGELTALVKDLPAQGQAVGAPAPPPEPKELVQIDCTSSVIKRDGQWVVPQRMELRVSSGSVILDFTNAVITQPTLRIDAEVHSGSLTLITKPGIVVDTDDVSVHSGATKVQAADPTVPVALRVQVSGAVWSGAINARPPLGPKEPRRTFWQWLLRRPKPRALPAP